MKRSPSSGIASTLKESSAFQSELRMPESAIRHQNASPSEKGKVTICDGKSSDEERPKKNSVCKSIEGCQDELLAQVVREISFNFSHFIRCPSLVALQDRFIFVFDVHNYTCGVDTFFCDRWGHPLLPSYLKCSCFSWKPSKPTSSKHLQWEVAAGLRKP